jgi:hypothetical protein
VFVIPTSQKLLRWGEHFRRQLGCDLYATTFARLQPEIRRAVPVDNDVDCARLTKHTDGSFELGVLTGETDQRRKVAAGRLAPNSNLRGVKAQGPGMCAEIADGGLRIMQLSRKMRL